MSLNEKGRVAFIGLLIIAAYLEALKGKEIVKMMLGDFRRLCGESKEYTIHHVVLPLKGRFNGETR